MVTLMLFFGAFALVLLSLIAKAIINLEIKGCLTRLILWLAKFAAEALGDEADEEYGYLADVRQELNAPTFRPSKMLWDNGRVATPVLWQRARSRRPSGVLSKIQSRLGDIPNTYRYSLRAAMTATPIVVITLTAGIAGTGTFIVAVIEGGTVIDGGTFIAAAIAAIVAVTAMTVASAVGTVGTAILNLDDFISRKVLKREESGYLEWRRFWKSGGLRRC